MVTASSTTQLIIGEAHYNLAGTLVHTSATQLGLDSSHSGAGCERDNLSLLRDSDTEGQVRSKDHMKTWILNTLVEPSYTVHEINWYSHYGGSTELSLKN